MLLKPKEKDNGLVMDAVLGYDARVGEDLIDS
jgi:hypothetical protein